MGSPRLDWSRIHRRRSAGPLGWVLALLSRGYGAAVRARLWAYRNGVLSGKRLPGIVVSVGNITAGGTGKTPLVMGLARWVRDEGLPVAVLSRGYRGRHRGRILEVSDGETVKVSFEEAGDEPCLLAHNLPGIPVVVSRHRHEAGLYARKHFGTEVFILDDGFQHLALERDLDVVLMDSSDPVGNGCLLPQGPVREPIDQLARADVVVLTRAGGGKGGSGAGGLRKPSFTELPVFRADHVITGIAFPGSGETRPVEFLRGKRVAAFAGIGNPSVFRDSVVAAGAEVVGFTGFPDHHPYSAGEIESLLDAARVSGADLILTTEKDWVRMAAHPPQWAGFAYVTIRFEILSGSERFFGILHDVVHAQ